MGMLSVTRGQFWLGSNGFAKEVRMLMEAAIKGSLLGGRELGGLDSEAACIPFWSLGSIW
jgi:hypothetical protein